MRALPLLLAVALAGCSSTDSATDVADAAPTCPDPCLEGEIHPVLEDCDFVGLTLSIMEETYTLPEGYTAHKPGLSSTHPEASQMVYLMLMACQGSSFRDQPMGPVSFAEIALIIEQPADGAGTDFHQFVLQQAATGPLLETLRLHGFPVLEGTVTIEDAPTGRVARLAGDASLQADVVTGPFEEGTNPGFTAAHYIQGTWFTGYPVCTQGAPGTSVAVVDPGTSILVEATREGTVLRGGDTQDDDCRIDLHFRATGD